MNKNLFHLLMVDDDDKIRELVKQYLEENNFLVTTARDAIDAKQKLKIIKFDLLIFDIMMPGESGLSLTKETKKNISTPIILLTAKGETRDRIKGLELGAEDYLGKPFEPKQLLLRIKNILNKTKEIALPEEIYIGKKYTVRIVDRVGGGDAFASGIIYGNLQKNWSSQQILDFAVASSAISHTFHGDFNLVSIDEVNSIAKGDTSGRVQR